MYHQIGYNHPTVIPLPAEKPKDGKFVEEEVPSRFVGQVDDLIIMVVA